MHVPSGTKTLNHLNCSIMHADNIIVLVYETNSFCFRIAYIMMRLLVNLLLLGIKCIHPLLFMASSNEYIRYCNISGH